MRPAAGGVPGVCTAIRTLGVEAGEGLAAVIHEQEPDCAAPTAQPGESDSNPVRMAFFFSLFSSFLSPYRPQKMTRSASLQHNVRVGKQRLKKPRKVMSFKDLSRR